MTNADIGRQLFISEATVKTHLLRAFGKLGVSDRTAAVTTAIERVKSRRPAGDADMRGDAPPAPVIGHPPRDRLPAIGCPAR